VRLKAAEGLSTCFALPVRSFSVFGELNVFTLIYTLHNITQTQSCNVCVQEVVAVGVVSILVVY